MANRLALAAILQTGIMFYLQLQICYPFLLNSKFDYFRMVYSLSCGDLFTKNCALISLHALHVGSLFCILWTFYASNNFLLHQSSSNLSFNYKHNIYTNMSGNLCKHSILSIFKSLDRREKYTHQCFFYELWFNSLRLTDMHPVFVIL